ncbi:MAG TPA: symmetrical bis(5'-nucleosyl)-tetraphosphatase [Gammaproteobacteria bacterium]|nr:symmetrical bis(5'-nucleosyl)-tetraphosphatase [Gammaproteobacteria bacterium]
MATYAIGDVQGCYTALLKLLDHINFDPAKDVLWFTGDLVNRGSNSLEVLRFVKQLGNSQRTVLGNHDLHLLARAFGQHSGWKEDTLTEILQAPDRDELIEWLRQQPLFYYDADLEFALVHAGLAPSWDLQKSLDLAKEVEIVLQTNQITEFLGHMYGNEPNYWDDNLTSWARLRTITNHLTRIRFCRPDGSIDLSEKGPSDSPINRLIPWFRFPHRASENFKIIFGHWAALGGITNTPNAYSLDTGCVWGFKLTAMRLEDGKRFGVKCDSQDI